MEHRTKAKQKRPANKRPLKPAQVTPLKYLVVHATGTKTNMLVKEMDKLPYHFLITRGGRLLNLRPVGDRERTVEIAWLGGLDRESRHVDNRTEEQQETLFTTLILLSEQFPDAAIVPADELYPYGFSNPGFDLKDWLKHYLPSILFAAA